MRFTASGRIDNPSYKTAMNWSSMSARSLTMLGKAMLKNLLIILALVLLGNLLLGLYSAQASIADEIPQPPTEQFIVLAVWQIGADNMGVLLKDSSSGECYQYIGATEHQAVIIKKVDCPI